MSNLDYDDMQALWQVAGGRECATNQVLYHLASRGIEYDLLPWCQQQQMPVMAYSPLAQAGRLRSGLLSNPVVNDIARTHHVSVAQILLAWVIRLSGVMAIPKAASVAHVEQNAAALEIMLSVDELKLLMRHIRHQKVKRRWIWSDLSNDDAQVSGYVLFVGRIRR